MAILRRVRLVDPPRWVLPLGLLVAATALLLATHHAYYLATDDWFFVDFGRRPVSLGDLFELRRSGTPAVRPVALLWSRMESLAFGDAILPRRLLLLALHALNGLCLAALVRATGGARRVAALAALAFVVWPLHAEPLTWYHSGVTMLPFVSLVLLACVAWTRQRRALSTLLVAVALLTRENAVVAAPLVVWWEAAQGASLRASLRRSAPVLAVTALYVVWRVIQVMAALQSAPGAALPLGQSLLATAGYLAFHLAIPVHPAALGALAWAAICAAASGLLVWREPQRVLRAVVLMALLAAPFVLLYDTGDPLFELGNPEYERRWYHLYPLAAALAVPVGYALSRARVEVSVAALGALLTLQLLNAQLWAQPGPQLWASLAAARTTLAPNAQGETPPTALVLHEEAEGHQAVEAELLEHQFLDLRRILGRHAGSGPGGLQLYKVDPDGVRAQAIADARGYPLWRGLPPDEPPPPTTRYVRWRRDALCFEPVPVDALPRRGDPP